MSVDDYGIEVLKKSAEQILGSKAEYWIRTVIEEKAKITKTEVVNSQLSYTGRALSAATATSDALWQISRTITSDGVTTTEYAAEGAFTQVWDDRNTLFTVGGFFNQLSVDFDGINDYVDFGDVYNYSGVQAFSISLWIKPQNFAAIRLFAGKATNDANVYGWRIGIDTAGKIITQMRGPGQANGLDTFPTALTADVWTHIVWTYSGSGNKSGQSVYINGVKEVFAITGASVTAMTSTPFPLTIGRAPANYFVGNLDEFAMWDKELSQADVNEIYNAGVPADLTTLFVSGNLQSWWRLGDGDTFPTMLDQKGVANGTMTNMVAADIEADVP